MKVLLAVFLVAVTVCGNSQNEQTQQSEQSQQSLGLVGYRVKRGEDWQWGNQDGGARGTIVDVLSWKEEPLKGARVLWDSGKWNIYRWGAEDGKYDLVVVDDEPKRENIDWKPPKPKETRCKPEQRASLEELYQSLNGPAWLFQQGWEQIQQNRGQNKDMDTCVDNPISRVDRGMANDNLGNDIASENDPCLVPWTGVVCENGDVISLSLDQNGLKGKLPEGAFERLTALKSLDLSMNQISGTLPMSLRTLRHLEFLELKHNQMTGTLPPWLGEIINLSWLSLGGNRFEGTLPTEFAALSSLKHLYLMNNQLSIQRRGVSEFLMELASLGCVIRVEGNS